MTFVEWLKTQKDKRTNTGRIARVCLHGQDAYGFRFETDEDILTILKSFYTKGGHSDYDYSDDLLTSKYLPRARSSYNAVSTRRHQLRTKK